MRKSELTRSCDSAARSKVENTPGSTAELHRSFAPGFRAGKGEGFAETHGSHVVQKLVIDVVVVGGRKVRPSGIGQHRLEEPVTGQNVDIPLVPGRFGGVFPGLLRRCGEREEGDREQGGQDDAAVSFIPHGPKVLTAPRGRKPPDAGCRRYRTIGPEASLRIVSTGCGWRSLRTFCAVSALRPCRIPRFPPLTARRLRDIRR